MNILSTYVCWSPNDEDEPKGNPRPWNCVWDASCPEAAAERYAEQCLEYGDNFSSIDVRVRAPDGAISKFNVVVEYEAVFTALEIEEP